jgi:hypothetical protein
LTIGKGGDKARRCHEQIEMQRPFEALRMGLLVLSCAVTIRAAESPIQVELFSEFASFVKHEHWLAGPGETLVEHWRKDFPSAKFNVPTPAEK